MTENLRDTQARIASAVNQQRLLETALKLVRIYSPTRSAAEVADGLAEMLISEGFSVKRPVADWAESPAVALRYDSATPGPCLQFNGHLDTVPLPFYEAEVSDGMLTGLGAADMKGGIACCVEAVRVLRECELLQVGTVLLTAHDHHEGPWGDGRQVEALIRDGYTGDGVLIPEYLSDLMPMAGRGMAIFEANFRRSGEPTHEVLRPEGTGDVVGAAAEFAVKMKEWNVELSVKAHPVTGTDSAFVGLVQVGEIYNQSPVNGQVKGTRRWVAPGSGVRARVEIESMAWSVAENHGVEVDVEFSQMGDAFELGDDEPLVTAFQRCYRQQSGGCELPVGAKPFLDDGNRFCAAGVPSVTHGPASRGAHTISERVPVAELVRVAELYALIATEFAHSGE
ncbi:MAG: M20/M25/M40 family metallo-hydrolase [Candidatus Latescibacterota bacterium]|nr:M20/M25/M40 family metallo-hydrolase [Candidatus Latescibacterota bacterium]